MLVPRQAFPELAIQSSQRVTPALHRTSAERITDPAVIATMLGRLRDARQPVSLSDAAGTRSALSLVLAVAPDQGLVVLDSPSDPESARQLAAQGEAIVHASLKGVEISFRTALEPMDTDAGRSFRATLPRVLYYYQRRAHYRAHVGAGRGIAVMISGPVDTDRITGLLMDISVGGMGADVEPPAGGKLEVGDVVPRCLIELPTGIQVASAFEIRYLDSAERVRRVRLGGRFVDLDPPQRRLIERFVTEMERELIRTRPKDDV